MTSTENFSQRIDTLRKLIAEAEAIIIGAGSGLSTAAGLDYAGEDFRSEFAPWIEHYGFTDLYTSSSTHLRLRRSYGPIGRDTFGSRVSVSAARNSTATCINLWRGENGSW